MTKASDKKPKAPRKKRGRKSLFSARLAERILAMAANGATDKEIARAIGISLTTLKNWKGAHPDFLAALKGAKGVADDLVEAALFRRAVGYSQPAIKIMQHEGRIITKRYTEHYPPDTGAITLWLKNRRPEQWRDILAHEHTGKDGEPIATHQVTAIEITTAAQEAVKNATEPSEDF